MKIPLILCTSLVEPKGCQIHCTFKIFSVKPKIKSILSIIIMQIDTLSAHQKFKTLQFSQNSFHNGQFKLTISKASRIKKTISKN